MDKKTPELNLSLFSPIKPENIISVGGTSFSSLLESMQLHPDYKLLESSEVFKGSILNLSNENKLDEPHLGLNLDFNSIVSIINRANHFNIHAHSEFISGEGSLLLRENRELKLEVVSLQKQLTEKEKIVLRQQSKIKEMEVINQYYLSGGSPLVEVREVKFTSVTCELMIGQKRVKIEPASNQFYLCKMLFKNNKKFHKKFDLINFMDIFGESNSQDMNFRKVLYQSVRHLNAKISLETGISDLILYESRKVFLNTKHLPL